VLLTSSSSLFFLVHTQLFSLCFIFCTRVFLFSLLFSCFPFILQPLYSCSNSCTGTIELEWRKLCKGAAREFLGKGMFPLFLHSHAVCVRLPAPFINFFCRPPCLHAVSDACAQFFLCRSFPLLLLLFFFLRHSSGEALLPCATSSRVRAFARVSECVFFCFLLF
jgi:hypothetical protein